MLHCLRITRLAWLPRVLSTEVVQPNGIQSAGIDQTRAQLHKT